MNEDYYSGDGGMLSDNGKSGKKSAGGKKHKVKFRKMTRHVPRTEFGEIMGGLTIGMLLIFPALAMLTVVYPWQMLGIIAIIGCLFWVFTEDYIVGLLVAGSFVGMIVLGFVSIGILTAIFT